MSLAQLKEGVHFYFNESGLMVLTAIYLLEQGVCCGNGCLHCPFNYQNVPQEWQTILREKRQKRARNNCFGQDYEGKK